LVESLEEILTLGVGIVILGSGDESIQQTIRKAADLHKGRIGLSVGFNESLAHRIIAGSDIFIIPSRYEPCGLTQMYALKYGTVPVVRATGGLDDTIISFNSKTGKGNGFKFGSYDSEAFLSAIRDAVRLFQNATVWQDLMANGMKEDFSWDRSAGSYLDIYRSILNVERKPEKNESRLNGS